MSNDYWTARQLTWRYILKIYYVYVKIEHAQRKDLRQTNHITALLNDILKLQNHLMQSAVKDFHFVRIFSLQWL